jgi:hypothetical protein
VVRYRTHDSQVRLARRPAIATRGVAADREACT